MKKLFSLAAAAGVVVGGLFAMGGSAGADTSVAVPGVKGSGTASIVAPLNPQQKLVAFGCTAAATIVSASTSVDDCYLYADNVFIASAQSVSAPGQASATASTAAVPSLTSVLKVCYWVSADPVFTARVTDSGCTNVNTAVAALAVSLPPSST